MRAIHHISRHFVLYACLAYGISALVRVVEAILQDGPYWGIEADMMTQYFVNYPEHGFAKRALIGTLLRPVTGIVETPEAWVFWMMVAMNLLAFVAVLWLVQRYLAHRTGEGAETVSILRGALAVGSLGVMQIAHDLGRLDNLNFALMLGAVALVARGRVLVAGVVSVMGVLVHEGFTVYAAPLVIAVGWHALRRDGEAGSVVARLVPLVAMIAAASVAVLLYGNSESAVDVAHGVGGYVWARGVVEYNPSLPLMDVAILVAYWLALGAVLQVIYRSKGALDFLLIAALCALALNFLGIDHARWVTLAFYLVLVIVAVQVQVFGMRLRDPGRWQRWALYLLCLPLGPMGIISGFAWLPWP